jgi:hypothetical protein
MKNIKPVIYENLSTRQRVIASVEALARDDEEERLRLVSTCPKKTYHQTDWEYSQKMIMLIGMSISIECELREYGLNLFAALLSDRTSGDQWLQKIADTREAWKVMLRQMGIDPEAMKKAGLPSSPVLESIYGLLPEPVPENVEKLSAELNELDSRY